MQLRKTKNVSDVETEINNFKVVKPIHILLNTNTVVPPSYVGYHAISLFLNLPKLHKLFNLNVEIERPSMNDWSVFIK